jgi:hypothetical protein
MKPLNEFTAREIWHLRPLLYAGRDFRHGQRSRRLLRKSRPPASILDGFRAVSGRNALISIAFNGPDAIEWQRRLITRFVPNCIHIIADNSSDEEAAKAIEAVSAGGLYIRLPKNPWSGEEHTKSHGFALNWCWHHIVKPLAPSNFGFIDHDLFPTEQTDPFQMLEKYPIAGRVWDGKNPQRWHLWAGFCFFRMAAVKRKRLNFDVDFYAGLDTGGGNWKPLYRHLDRHRIPDPGGTDLEITDDGHTFMVQRVGSWLHRCNLGYDEGDRRNTINEWVWRQLRAV